MKLDDWGIELWNHGRDCSIWCNGDRVENVRTLSVTADASGITEMTIGLTPKILNIKASAVNMQKTVTYLGKTYDLVEKAEANSG